MSHSQVNIIFNENYLSDRMSVCDFEAIKSGSESNTTFFGEKKSTRLGDVDISHDFAPNLTQYDPQVINHPENEYRYALVQVLVVKGHATPHACSCRHMDPCNTQETKRSFVLLMVPHLCNKDIYYFKSHSMSNPNKSRPANVLKCTWGHSATTSLNHSEEAIFLENECCTFLDQVLYRIEKQGCFLKEIRWMTLPIVCASGNGVLSELHVAQVSVGRLVEVSPTWTIEEEVVKVFFLKDGTPYEEYQKSMRDEEKLKSWWLSPERCQEMEDKDVLLQTRYGITYGKHRIPIPKTLSPNNAYLVYRGPCIKMYVPVYKKIRELWSKERKEIIYRFSHVRVLVKFAAFYRIQDAPAVYKYGGHHVFARSGRRFVGNPWFNTVGNECILGAPFDEIRGQVHPQCPKFWNWQYHDSIGWSSFPMEG